MCKDCHNSRRLLWLAAAAWMIAACRPVPAEGGTVRVRANAVVTAEGATLGDVCDLSQLEAEAPQSVADIVVVPPPAAGRSTYVGVNAIQEALRRAGVNLAHTIVTGASRCAITRAPSAGVHRLADPEPRRPDARNGEEAPGRTLRDAVRDMFARLAEQRGGRIELRFARTPTEVLNLSEPRHRFSVRLRSGQWLGRMVKVEVDVRGDDGTLETIPLVVNASIVRDVVVAHRAINLEATVTKDDVELAERLYDDLGEAGVSNIDAVVGRRAKRFIRAGEPIRMSDLEVVPLVTRGQLVDVISKVGPIEARTVGRAMGGGTLGDVVELRIGGRRGKMLTGLVTGQRRVVVGGGTMSSDTGEFQLALGAER